MNLFNHQTLTIDFMKRTPRAAVFLEMGLGKSLCAIEATKHLDRVLVVCPNYLKATWAAEYQKWRAGFPHIINAKGRRDALRSSYWPKIINYEGLRIETELIKELKPEAIIFDESQYIKERSSQVTKAAWQITANPETRVYCMTGTPICNGFQDYYAQYKILRPAVFRTWTEFSRRFLIMGGYGGYQVVGHRNEEVFRKLTDPYTIRLKKEDCLDLPQKIYQRVYVEMPADLKAAYRQMAQEAALEIDQATTVTADMVNVRLMRLQQLCAGWIGEVTESGERVVHTVAPNPKMDPLISIINDNPGQQVLVWAHFRKDIADIVAALEKANITCGYINGGVPPTERQELIDAFQAGQKRALVIQDSIVAGMTLTAASLVIYYQNSYSYANRIQSEDRCHRIGQRRSVTYIDLVTKGSVEERILKAIERKENLTHIVDKNTLRQVFLEGVKEC